MNRSDKYLAYRAARRDQLAFAELYDRYVEKIYKYIYYKSGRSEMEAEDLTAQVFTKAWAAIDRYHWEGYPFSTWLYRIASNQMIDTYRTRRETLPLENARTQSDGSDPLESVERAITSARVRDALQHLTDDQQRVISLRFLLGYSTAETADIMDKQPDAIRALQHRALHAMQTQLGADEIRPLVARAAHAAASVS